MSCSREGALDMIRSQEIRCMGERGKQSRTAIEEMEVRRGSRPGQNGSHSHGLSHSEIRLSLCQSLSHERERRRLANASQFSKTANIQFRSQNCEHSIPVQILRTFKSAPAIAEIASLLPVISKMEFYGPWNHWICKHSSSKNLPKELLSVSHRGHIQKWHEHFGDAIRF